MAINIFDNPDTENTERKNLDVVGRFRAGYQANSRPVSLQEWRATTGDPEVAECLVEILGAKEYAEWDTKTGEIYEIFGTKSSVDVIFDDANAVRTSMILWGRNGKKIRECDGNYLVEDGKTTDTPCPSCSQMTSLDERKEAYDDGHGCGPNHRVTFRLADDPDLGRFRFYTSSWTAIRDFNAAEERLTEINGPATGVLELEIIEGSQRTFTKPKVTVTGPADG